MTTDKRNMAVLFADVVDSTKMYEALGDTMAYSQIQKCIGTLRAATVAAGGRVVKTIGDAAMCVFPTADAAAHAACGMQEQIAELREQKHGKLAIRIGFHFGAVLEEGADVFGDSVNVAARVSGLAKASQIFTTGETVETLSGWIRQSARQLNTLPVKGKQEEVDLYEIVWMVDSDRTLMPGRAAPVAGPVEDPVLSVTHLGATATHRDSLTLGRSRDCTIVISDPMASRQHAKIELRRGKFVLTDTSMNGTFVTLGGGVEVKLLREEIVLQGSGTIAFGHSVTAADAEKVEFNCEWTGPGGN